MHLLCLAYSQNWRVFNKNYRYNYSLQSENYTTIVIFADSVLTQGTDTIYSLNRIAARCDSCFFYYPEAGVEDTNYIIINQPQFMQKRIVYANNQYRLSDTGNYILPQFTSAGNMWVFNATGNITAQHIGSSIKNYFGVSDSVKTILLSTGDTILISKQLGIIKYPAKFGQHRYYILRGIENATSYDVFSLYGEKVPNYYDFFKLKPGVIQYYSTTSTWSGSQPQCYSYLYGRITAISSSITGTVISNSYIDDRKGCLGNCATGMWGSCIMSNPFTFPSVPVNSYTISNAGASSTNFFNHSLYNSYNNNLYIGMNDSSKVYVIKFGKTTNDHFFKTYGESCFSSHIQNNPIPNFQYSLVYHRSLQNNMVYYGKGDESAPFMTFGETFIEGYGQVNSFFPGFETLDYYCTSAIIDGADTLGDITIPNIITAVKNEEKSFSSFGPNPTKDIVTISFPFEVRENTGTIEVKDIYGKIVFQKTVNGGASSEQLNLQNLAQGIYFIDIKIPHFQKQYKVIKE